MRTKRRLIVPVLISILLVGSLICGLWMWYDGNVDRSGWAERDGVRFYQDFYGDPVSGWLDIDGARYYFHDDGTPVTGWQDMGGVSYYFQEDGVMATGWQNIGGKTYYFTGDGTPGAGWLYLEEGRYYLEKGVPSTGWQDIENKRYYFDSQGVMALGFTPIAGDTYYFDEEGVMLAGQQIIDERIFYFGENGVMRTGWDETEDGRRYYYEDGPMARGWTNIGSELFYFQPDGLMQTGWMTQGEYSYYLFPDGHAAIGPNEIDGQTHYFSPKGVEIVLVNAKNPVPDYYTMELKNVVSHFEVDSRCYDALMWMLSDCNDAGISYTFNSGYRTIKEQTEILELRTAEHMKTYDLSYTDAKEKALETVALPGTSEHHLGLAVDLLGSEAIAWFQEHCWDYGFILRYTAEKYPITGIIDEPWHFRYVGKEVALDIKASGLSLEEYLGAEAVKPGAVPSQNIPVATDSEE